MGYGKTHSVSLNDASRTDLKNGFLNLDKCWESWQTNHDSQEKKSNQLSSFIHSTNIVYFLCARSCSSAEMGHWKKTKHCPFGDFSERRKTLDRHITKIFYCT